MAKYIHASFQTILAYDKEDEVEKFNSVLKMSSNALLGDDLYALNLSHQTQLWQPQQTPKEDEVAKLREYTTNETVSAAADAKRGRGGKVAGIYR